ncbi:MAG TPA: formylmethanofuran dehydrogenase subunit E family protein [Methanomassiliicoccales archaeon]|jgi:formylmethanofuran dehydrogenase subunit E
MKELPDELVSLKRFHGHLGPYVVVGYRMGMIARPRFGHKLQAVVFTGRHPPMSCLIDGIQLSTGCTMGKNNIAVRDGHLPVVHFMDSTKTVEVRLVDSERERIDRTMTKENEEELSVQVLNADERGIFQVTEVASGLPERLVKLK